MPFRSLKDCLESTLQGLNDGKLTEAMAILILQGTIAELTHDPKSAAAKAAVRAYLAKREREKAEKARGAPFLIAVDDPAFQKKRDE